MSYVSLDLPLIYAQIMPNIIVDLKKKSQNIIIKKTKTNKNKAQAYN